MNVEVWHRLESGGLEKAHCLTISSLTDESTCELAYMHTKEGSITQLQEVHVRGTTVGDVVVIVDDDTTVPPRAYQLDGLSASSDQPSFRRITWN